MNHHVEGPLLPGLCARHADDVLSDMILVSRTLRKMRSDDGKEENYSAVISSQEKSSGPVPIVSTSADVNALVHHAVGNDAQLMEVVQHILDSGLLGELTTGEENEKSEEDEDLKELITTTLLRFGCNNFAVTSSQLAILGAAVCPAGAILNHACQPNCVVTWNDKTGAQEIRCVRKVTKDEELTHSYIDVGTLQRRKKLKLEYGFECECSRCSSPTMVELAPCFRMELKMAAREHTSLLTTDVDSDGTIADMVIKLNEKSDDPKGKWNLDDCLHGDLLGVAVPAVAGGTSLELARLKDVEAASELMRGTLTTLSDTDKYSMLKKAETLYSKWLHPLHVDRLHSTNELLKVALSLQDYKKAVSHVRRVIVVYDHVYSTSYYHPMVGIQLYTLGNLYTEIQKFKEAASTLGRSLETLRATHGETSDLVLTLNGLWHQTVTVLNHLQKGGALHGATPNQGTGRSTKAMEKKKKKKKGKKGKR